MDKKKPEQYNAASYSKNEYGHLDLEQKKGYSLLSAFGIVMLTITGEYVFRHFTMFWFPTIGNLNVNDMISLLFAYILIVGGIGKARRINWRHEWVEIQQGLRYLVTSRSGTVWILVLILAFEGFGVVDKLFMAKYTLPMYLSPFRNSTVWLTGLAPILKVISLLIVNGIYIPIAEEFLWHGLVQVYLTRVLNPILSISIVAILFSFKHVLVDASFGRFFALIAFGAVCGILAYQKSWQNSAALHMIINTIFTIAGLIMAK